jgi:hypothetical protein
MVRWRKYEADALETPVHSKPSKSQDSPLLSSFSGTSKAIGVNDNVESRWDSKHTQNRREKPRIAPDTVQNPVQLKSS